MDFTLNVVGETPGQVEIFGEPCIIDETGCCDVRIKSNCLGKFKIRVSAAGVGEAETELRVVERRLVILDVPEWKKEHYREPRGNHNFIEVRVEVVDSAGVVDTSCDDVLLDFELQHAIHLGTSIDQGHLKVLECNGRPFERSQGIVLTRGSAVVRFKIMQLSKLIQGHPFRVKIAPQKEYSRISHVLTPKVKVKWKEKKKNEAPQAALDAIRNWMRTALQEFRQISWQLVGYHSNAFGRLNRNRPVFSIENNPNESIEQLQSEYISTVLPAFKLLEEIQSVEDRKLPNEAFSVEDSELLSSTLDITTGIPANSSERQPAVLGRQAGNTTLTIAQTPEEMPSIKSSRHMDDGSRTKEVESNKRQCGTEDISSVKSLKRVHDLSSIEGNKSNERNGEAEEVLPVEGPPRMDEISNDEDEERMLREFYAEPVPERFMHDATRSPEKTPKIQADVHQFKDDNAASANTLTPHGEALSVETILRTDEASSAEDDESQKRELEEEEMLFARTPPHMDEVVRTECKETNERNDVERLNTTQKVCLEERVILDSFLGSNSLEREHCHP